MPADLFGDRFLSFRQPAWHGCGTIVQEQTSAREALELIGRYDVRLEELQTSDGFKVSSRAVLRQPTSDDPVPRELGIVGPEYVLIPPYQICEIWDASVKAPVETIGALYKGSTLFITTKLPTIDVRGDDVDTYLLLISPMSGMEALQGRVTGVRVVCSNTLQMAKQDSTETYRIVHDRHAVIKLQAALDGLYSRAAQRVAQFKDLFGLMADHRVTNTELNTFIDDVYTIPAQPDVLDLPEKVAQQRMESWEYNAAWYQRRQSAVREDFEGRGVGSDTRAFKGSVWGLYNAVAEVEAYAGRGGTIASRGQDVLMGQRGGIIEKAYVAALSLVK